MTDRTRTFCTQTEAPAAHALGCWSLIRRMAATPVALVAPIYHDENLYVPTDTDKDRQTDGQTDKERKRQ